MIIRRRHTANFTTIGNMLFDDERLAADELGILCYLLSKPHDWEVRRKHLMSRFHIGRDGLRRVFNNYMRTGWAWAQKAKRPDGTFYVIYEIRDQSGPELTDEEIKWALSLGSSEAAQDQSINNDAEICADASPSAQPCAPPVTCQPPLAQPPPARAYVADKNILNTDSPRTESDQNERGRDGGYDRKAGFIAAFEARWPTSAIDDRARAVKAARDLLDEDENAALSGIGPFLEKLKREGRKHVPAGWKYLEEKRWTLLDQPKPGEPTSQKLAAGSAEAKAIGVLFAIVGKQSFLHSNMKSSDGGLYYRREVTPRLLALANAPPQGDWPHLTRQQAGAWNEFLSEYLTVATWSRLAEGSRAPFAWPPRKDGSLSTAPPDDLKPGLTADDEEILARGFR